MNKQEFQSLPPDLQRDVRLAVALGWPLESVRCDGETVDVRENRMAAFPWRRFDPTQSREIWAALLEVFPIAVVPQIDNYEVWFAEQYAESTRHPHLPTAVVLEVIRRDPLGHLSRSGL